MQTKHYSIEQYLNIRQAYAPTFSPRGDKIAFLTDITGVPQVWQVALGSADKGPLWADQLTFGAERVFGAWFSPVDENLLLYGRDVGGDENVQLFLFSLNDGVEHPLTGGYEKAMHTPGGWKKDGSAFLFAANRRHAGLFDLYLQPLEGEARLVWQNREAGFLYNICFSPEEQRVLLTRMVSSFKHDLLEIDLNTGQERLLSAANAQVVYEYAAYTADGSSLLLCTDQDWDFTYLARYDLATRTLTPLVQTDADVEFMLPAPDGSSLVYALNRQGVSEIFLLDLFTGAQRRAPAFGCSPGMLLGQPGMDCFAFAPDSRSLAMAYSGSCCPTDIYLWRFDTDQVQPLTRSSSMGIPRRAFSAPELVEYPTFDDDPLSGARRMIPGWLYRPAQRDEKLPVVVYVHGGPEGQFRPNFLPVIQYLVHQGYAVLAPNVRGSTGYGKAYSHLDDVEKRMDSVADLAHAARWVKQQPGLDGDRIAVYGASYGGFMVLSSLTTYPELWSAGVDIVGISNFVTFLENTSTYRRAHREAEYGNLSRDRSFLERISPGNQLEQIQAPLIVIHGANDPRVPLSETLQLVEKLETRGVPVETMIFDDEGHGLIKLKNKLQAYPAVISFLERYLKLQ